MPNPGLTEPGNLPQAINFDFANVNRADNLVLKSDYHPNDKHTLSGRLVYANTNQTEVTGSPIRPEWLTRAIVYTQVFGADWTWTPSSRWNNQAKFSYDRFWETVDPVDHNLDPKSAYGIDTGITDPKLFGFLSITFRDFDYMGGIFALPLWTTPSGMVAPSDIVSFTSGKHTFKIGGSCERGEVNYLLGGTARGRVDFTTLENFFRGNARRGVLAVGDLSRSAHMTSWSTFINDDFRATSRLTFNLGLRYDVALPIKEDRNLIANVLPDRGVLQVGKGIDSPYQTNWKNISPRLGVAWDVFGNNKTVLRAGGGLIFVQPVIHTFINGRGLNFNPSGVAGVLPGNGTINAFRRFLGPSDINFTGNGPIFDVPGITSSSSCSSDPADNNSCNFFAVDPHLKSPYVTNWTVNLQQTLSLSTMLQVAFVGNRGTKLYSRKGINEPNRTATRQCLLDETGENIVDAVVDADFTFCEQANRPLVTNCTTGAGRCWPFMQFLTFLGNDAKSSYHALQVTLTKRYSRGLYLVAGYTYGHAIDNATGDVVGVPQDSLNYQADWGNGDYDIRHRFTLSATYDIPSIKSKWQMLEGWQATSIVTLEGGEPLTAGNRRWARRGRSKRAVFSLVVNVDYVYHRNGISGIRLFAQAAGAKRAGSECACVASAQPRRFLPEMTPSATGRVLTLGALLFLLAIHPVKAQQEANWTWKETDGKIHTRAELDEIVRGHKQWLESAGKSGKQAELIGADLHGAVLGGVDLPALDLMKAEPSGADLAGATLHKANLNKAELAYADLSKAVLIVADLSEAFMFGAKLSNADLSSANLNDASIMQADLTNANLSEADLSKARLLTSKLVGADLSKANLSGALLAHTDMSRAKLIDTDLSGTDLTNANLNGVIFEPKSYPDPRVIAQADNLELMTYVGNPGLLVQLRKQFADEGFREQERKITYALKRKETELSSERCRSRKVGDKSRAILWSPDSNLSNCASFVLNRVFF